MITLSPDTDRRFIETVIARGLVPGDALETLERERARSTGLGERTRSLAEMCCDAGLLDRTSAAAILEEVRAERKETSSGAQPSEGRDAQVGPYTLLAELGRGGMGVVHKARHRPTGALRALKVLTGSIDLEVVVRFRREAEALARVGGDSVVPVHEVIFERGTLAIGMDLMPGGSLSERLRARGRLEWREAVLVAIAIAHALERCHAAGLVHRDLKPDNVLFDEEDRPRLADFGIVRDLTGTVLTETGTILGTPRYMAPEQLEGKPVDARVDIYALGIVLFELVAGVPAHEGRSPVEIFRSKKRGGRRPLPEGPPPGLGAIVDHALAPDPADRYPDALAFRRELEGLLAGAPPRRPPRRRRRLAVLAVAGLASVATAALLVRRSGGPSDIAAVSSRTPDTPPATSSSVDVATIRSELARLQGAIDDGKGRLAASALTRARKAGYSPEPKEAAELAERALAAAEKTVEENSRAGMDTRAAPAALEEALAFCEVARTLGSRAPVPDAVNDLAFNVSLALKGAPDQRERRRALRRMADLGVRRISDLLVYAATATWDREGDPGKLKLVEELLADCKIALAEVADLPAALYLRGRILAHDEPGFPREFPEARLMIERAIEGWRKQGPRTREQALWENYYLAMAQDRTGDAARAFKTLDDVWRDRPRGVEIFDRLRARVAMETGDWEGGVEALDEGVTTAVEPAKSVLRLHLDAARRAGADPTLRADVIEKLRHRLRD